MTRPTRSARRRLSRTIPWQLPVVALLLVCVIPFAIWRPLRAREGAPAPLAAGGAGAPAPASGPAGDPLADPAVQASALEDEAQINILLLGTDGRDEEDGPPRTDLVMLALLNRAEGRATLVSIPRDLWVPIPGYGEGKLNTAYFLGSLEGDGAALARETVQALAGVPIHHTIQIDFNGFRALIDGMGGLELDVPTAIDDPEFPDGNYGTFRLQIPAGRQTMDGERALQYARTRYGGTDQDRAARQQAVLLAMRERALSPTQLARAPLHLRSLYRLVESDLALGDFFALARLARSLDRERIAMHTLDGDLTWPVTTWNGLDALLYDPATVRGTVRGWAAGR